MTMSADSQTCIRQHTAVKALFVVKAFLDKCTSFRQAIHSLLLWKI